MNVGFSTVLSPRSLSFIVSFLVYLPGLIFFLLRMSPFALIKLFLGSVFKRTGFEEEEHLCAMTENGAGEVGIEMVLARAAIEEKDKELAFPLVEV